MVAIEKVQKVTRVANGLPAGWQKTTLAEVAEIIMGQLHIPLNPAADSE